MVNSIDELIATALEGNLQEFRHNNIELKRNWRKEYGKKISVTRVSQTITSNSKKDAGSVAAP